LQGRSFQEEDVECWTPAVR